MIIYYYGEPNNIRVGKYYLINKYNFIVGESYSKEQLKEIARDRIKEDSILTIDESYMILSGNQLKVNNFEITNKI